MKYVLSILFLIGLIAVSLAQYSRSEKDSAFNEVRGLTEKWYKAAKERDSVTIEKLLAPGFTLNGDVPRSVWMDRALHHIKMDTLRNVGSLHFEYYGGAVVSKGNMHWKAFYDGTYDLTGDYPFEDIWIKIDGQWKVLIRLSLKTTSR
jgi:hypothetical protein